jgi:hypothetical protein
MSAPGPQRRFVAHPQWRRSEPPTKVSGKECLLCPNGSHINLFSHLERVIDFDAKISRGALDFGMAQQ